MLIEEFFSAVALDDRDGHCVNHLIGSEALAAGGTFTAALNAAALAYGTGVKNSGIGKITCRTFHNRLLNKYLFVIFYHILLKK
jgi:hypothetical protein